MWTNWNISSGIWKTTRVFKHLNNAFIKDFKYKGWQDQGGNPDRVFRGPSVSRGMGGLLQWLVLSPLGAGALRWGWVACGESLPESGRHCRQWRLPGVPRSGRERDLRDTPLWRAWRGLLVAGAVWVCWLWARADQVHGVRCVQWPRGDGGHAPWSGSLHLPARIQLWSGETLLRRKKQKHDMLRMKCVMSWAPEARVTRTCSGILTQSPKPRSVERTRRAKR